MVLDFGKELQEFYEKNKDNKLVLSKEEIIKISKKIFSFSNYSLYQPFYKEKFENVIFGLRDGVCFTNRKIIFFLNGVEPKMKEGVEYSFDQVPEIKLLKYHLFKCKIGDHIHINAAGSKKKYDELYKLINDELLSKIQIKVEKFKAEKQKQKAEKQKQKAEILQKREKQRIAKLNVSQDNVLKELDKDGNGEVDVVEGNDFSLLLKKHQKSIIEIDRTYVQQFVKVSSYLKTKKNNIQLMFNSIKDTSNQKELNEYVGILKNEIHSYSLILFNSLNMIVSLVEDEMVTFYEIHDSFDKLNIFNSNWENEISQKLINIEDGLSNIGDGLSNLMYSVEEMGQNISNKIGNLSYVTEESNRMLSDQLQDIDSSLQANNLLTTLQTHQMYKINKNTKGLIN